MLPQKEKFTLPQTGGVLTPSLLIQPCNPPGVQDKIQVDLRKLFRIQSPLWRSLYNVSIKWPISQWQTYGTFRTRSHRFIHPVLIHSPKRSWHTARRVLPRQTELSLNLAWNTELSPGLDPRNNHGGREGAALSCACLQDWEIKVRWCSKGPYIFCCGFNWNENSHDPFVSW